MDNKGISIYTPGVIPEELREQFKESIKEVILDEADSNPELVKVSVIVTSY